MDGIAVSVCPYAKKVKILPFLAMLLKEKHEEEKTNYDIHTTVQKSIRIASVALKSIPVFKLTVSLTTLPVGCTSAVS